MIHAATPDLILIRDFFGLKMTTGQLHYKGTPLVISGKNIFFGEDVARPDGVKIQNETAIWAGDYWIALTQSARFGKVLPLIYNSDDLSCSSGNKKFTGVRQHPGNTEADTDACQLAGTGRNTAGVWSSNAAMDIYLPWLTGKIAEANGRIAYRIINQQP